MTFGPDSAIFREWLASSLAPVAGFNGQWDPSVATPSDFKVALFGDTGTPDKTVAVGLTAYGAGQWIAGNEVTDPEWAAGGLPLDAISFDSGPAGALDSIVFDADDLTHAAGTQVTLQDVFGDLLYLDDGTNTPANQGAAFHSFGGLAQSVTAGTFTIIWHQDGVMVVSV